MPDDYRTRRIIVIAVIALVILLFGYAFYRFLASRRAEIAPGASPQPPVSGPAGAKRGNETPPGPQITPLQSPTAGLEDKIKQQTLMALTDFSVIAPVITKNAGKVLFYKKDGGSVYGVDFAGNKEKLSNITIVGLTDVAWSPARDRGVVFYLDNETLKSFLHIGTSSVISLPLDIKSLAWSPDGKQFAYTVANNNGVSLFIADASGKNTTEVFKTPILDAEIQWISADKIAFQTAPSGQAGGFIFIYSLKNKSFQKLVGPLFGLTALWSPDASRLLVGSTNGGGSSHALSLYDASGHHMQKFDFITLPEKCAWANPKVFYCAIPDAFPGNAVMPDDYLRGEIATQDHILLFNLDTQGTNSVFSGGAMSMDNISVTPNRDYLIFVNRTDGILWRLKLTQ